MRPLIAFAVVVALQALAGCGKPAKSDVARADPSAWREAEFATHEARWRWQVETGTLGLAQLYPEGKPVDPRRLPPLRPPSAVRNQALAAPVAQSSPAETPVDAASAAEGEADPCVYKPVMSNTDLDACR